MNNKLVPDKSDNYEYNVVAQFIEHNKSVFYGLLFIFCFLLFTTKTVFSAAIPSSFVNSALEIMNDPLLLPLEIHFDMLDLMPADPKKRVQIEIPVTSLVFDLGSTNASIKVRLTDDGFDQEGVMKYLPRIALVGGYWTNVPISMAPSFAPDTLKSAAMGGYDYGINIAKVVAKDENDTTVEFFAGYRNLYDSFKLFTSTPIKITETSSITMIEKSGNTGLVHFGITRRYTDNYEASAQVGLDLERRNLFLHFMFGGKIARYGFGVYPDSLIFLKPFFSVHYRF